MEINKKIKLLDFKVKKDIWNLLFGAYKSVFSWNWIDFLEQREYIPWDPVKNINWKTIWKTDKIHTKIFEEDRDLNVLFLLDMNSFLEVWFFEKTKKDLLEEVFYCLAKSCNYSGDNLWVYIFWNSEKPMFFSYKKWSANIYKTIDFLEKNRKKYDFDLAESLKYISKKNITKNLIFILSDDLSTENKEYLKFLSVKNEIIFINIFDYFENNLYNININANLSNSSDFVNISLNDKKKIEEYKNLRLQKIQKFRLFLKKYNIEYILLDTKKDVYRELYLFFSKLKI